MTTEIISVPEIHCDHCKNAIEGALAPIEGVTSASVDIGARTVEVTYDEGVVERAQLTQAIEDQGYEISA